MESTFASYIDNYLKGKYGKDAESLFSMSYILQYLENNLKIFNLDNLIVYKSVVYGISHFD